MLTFLDLPAEVRLIVYELSLVSDQIMFPNVTYYERMNGIRPYSETKQKLAIGLVGTNRIIRTEATHILFGKNTWHLSVPLGSTAAEQLWPLFGDLIHDVKLNFDLQDLKPKARCKIACKLLHGDLDNASRRETAHDEALLKLESKWFSKYYVLLKDMHNLKNVTVDLTNCFCPSSCCRQTWYVLGSLLQYCSTFEGQLLFPRYHITGLHGIEEWRLVHKAGFGCDSCPVKDGKVTTESCEWEEKELWNSESEDLDFV